jgi:hypothetical protein
MSRFLLALIRNCGVAVAISIFFAAAHEPSHRPAPGTPVALPGAAASRLDPVTPTQKTRECERPPGRVCRLVEAWHRVSAENP